MVLRIAPRPATVKKKVSAAIDESLIQLLDQLIRGTERSRSAVIETAIRTYLRNILDREGVG